ncbi:hypothetical protein HO133_002725 [Letharia lupina]|uniref:PHD-type domain-containing protein n=1 Tax=Letharia lupina TaxID=560253 RepID=A0A8H6FAW5_9LECA|nr:uncharacterized protein HO133_002725 [Letharia lupina]KAF6221044.1 hypothetical protein HO133_002725 [Letharia lupina]
MGSRKRNRDEMEFSEPAPELSMLDKLRNTWELANLMQYIYIFGKAVKIDEDLTIEDLETECLKPESSQVLSDIGLALLKYVSSHRGLTPEIFDEYTRRQYVAKAPSRNPFGIDEEPRKFPEFDVFLKLKVLVQLSQWTLINADRMRERMPEAKDSEQTQWRIEEVGYDKHERYYFVLDDNRLYRRTDPPPPSPPAPKAKSKSKKGKAAARASKRRKTIEPEDSANDADNDTPAEVGDAGANEADDGFGGRKWECIAITLGQYQEFLESIQKSRDPDEKDLYRRIKEEVWPVIEKAEESQVRKKQKQERELMNMQKLATAKRSSRLEAKMERERQEQEVAEAERKRKADLVAAKQNQEKQKRMEEDRESRMLTREQRLKEREYKRILQEEELANLSEENKKVEAGEAKKSERHLKTEIEKRMKELAALAEDDEWVFDCSKCGVHGTNLDDGSHSVACEKCNVWQHSACLGISQTDAEKDDFHFICQDCKRREEDAKKPKIPSLKFRIGSSSSPPQQKPKLEISATNEDKKRKSSEERSQLPPSKKFKPVVDSNNHHRPNAHNPRAPHNGQNGMHAAVMNGPTLSPQGQLPRQSIYAGNQEESFFTRRAYPDAPPPGLRSPPGPPAYANGYNNHVTPHNGYVPQLPPQAFQSLDANGAYQSSHQPHNVGWSARYTPTQQPQHAEAYGPPPPSQNPFTNSFDRQTPSASHSTHNVPSPDKNGPSLSPPQNSPPLYNPPHHHSPQHPTPHTNGASPNQPLPATGPPAFSPTKQQSPAAASKKMQPPSSSPVAHQPPLQSNAPSSPGLSPTKHSPPRAAPGLGVAGTPAVIPPVAQLSPSPMQQSLNAALKSATPE